MNIRRSMPCRAADSPLAQPSATVANAKVPSAVRCGSAFVYGLCVLASRFSSASSGGNRPKRRGGIPVARLLAGSRATPSAPLTSGSSSRPPAAGSANGGTGARRRLLQPAARLARLRITA